MIQRYMIVSNYIFISKLRLFPKITLLCGVRFHLRFSHYTFVYLDLMLKFLPRGVRPAVTRATAPRRLVSLHPVHWQQLTDGLHFDKSAAKPRSPVSLIFAASRPSILCITTPERSSHSRTASRIFCNTNKSLLRLFCPICRPTINFTAFSKNAWCVWDSAEVKMSRHCFRPSPVSFLLR